jgi:hypothetical protein
MEEDKIAKWQQRLEETFIGPRGIVGERILRFDEIEQEIFNLMIKKFKGHNVLMDSFLDFYIETLENVAARKKTNWPTIKMFFTAVHIATLWRLKSSYSLFWHGYFAEAISLLRAVFENALDMAALKLNIITLEERLSKLTSKDAESLSDKEQAELVRKYNFQNDRKVKRYLIGKESGLNSDAQEDFESFLRLHHNAVHKSTLNIFWTFGPWVRGERSLSLYPTYNEKPLSMCMNFSLFNGWLVLRTLPLLQIEANEFSITWQKKYIILDESFAEAISSFPKRLGRSVEELVDKKFNFNFK